MATTPPSDRDEIFAANLRSEMARLEITIFQLAKDLDCSTRTVDGWRAGTTPSFRSVRALADYFGRDLDWFFTKHNHSPKAVA